MNSIGILGIGIHIKSLNGSNGLYLAKESDLGELV